MAQQPEGPQDTGEPQPEGERLTGTVGGYLQRALGLVGGTSAILAAAGAVAVVLGGILYLSAPELGRSALTILAVGGILLLAAMTISFSAVRTAVAGRRGRYTTNSTVMTLAFVLIAALVAFVAFRNAVRIDVTATKQFSLAPQTVEILTDLPEPVRATAFFVPGDPQQDVVRTRVDDLLHEFAARTNKFTYRFVDPDAEPAVARQYKLTQYQVVVFEGMESLRTSPVLTPPVEEQQFATALLISTGVERKRVYFLTGHGEKDVQDVQPGSTTGYGLAAQGLTGDNYQPLLLNLAQVEKVPDDAAVVVAAGPQKDLPEVEAALLQAYLKRGGRGMFLVEPATPDSWRDLLARWAVKVGKDTIVDTSSSLAADPRTIIISSAQYSGLTPITQILGPTLFPGATSLDATTDKLPQTLALVPLAVTTGNSWTTPSAEDKTFQEGRDTRGPFFPALVAQALAPLGEQPDPSATREARLVVFGDSDFGTNQFFYASSNSDLFLNSVNWLTEDISLISVRPKPFAFRQLVVTTREMQFIRYSSLFLLPLGVAFLGGVIWWRRR